MSLAKKRLGFVRLMQAVLAIVCGLVASRAGRTASLPDWTPSHLRQKLVLYGVDPDLPEINTELLGYLEEAGIRIGDPDLNNPIDKRSPATPPPWEILEKNLRSPNLEEHLREGLIQLWLHLPSEESMFIPAVRPLAEHYGLGPHPVVLEEPDSAQSVIATADLALQRLQRTLSGIRSYGIDPGRLELVIKNLVGNYQRIGNSPAPIDAELVRESLVDALLEHVIWAQDGIQRGFFRTGLEEMAQRYFPNMGTLLQNIAVHSEGKTPDEITRELQPQVRRQLSDSFAAMQKSLSDSGLLAHRDPGQALYQQVRGEFLKKLRLKPLDFSFANHELQLQIESIGQLINLLKDNSYLSLLPGFTPGRAIAALQDYGAREKAGAADPFIGRQEESLIDGLRQLLQGQESTSPLDRAQAVSLLQKVRRRLLNQQLRSGTVQELIRYWIERVIASNEISFVDPDRVPRLAQKAYDYAAIDSQVLPLENGPLFPILTQKLGSETTARSMVEALVITLNGQPIDPAFYPLILEKTTRFIEGLPGGSLHLSDPKKLPLLVTAFLRALCFSIGMHPQSGLDSIRLELLGPAFLRLWGDILMSGAERGLVFPVLFFSLENYPLREGDPQGERAEEERLDFLRWVLLQFDWNSGWPLASSDILPRVLDGARHRNLILLDGENPGDFFDKAKKEKPWTISTGHTLLGQGWLITRWQGSAAWNEPVGGVIRQLLRGQVLSALATAVHREPLLAEALAEASKRSDQASRMAKLLTAFGYTPPRVASPSPGEVSPAAPPSPDKSPRVPEWASGVRWQLSHDETTDLAKRLGKRLGTNALKLLPAIRMARVWEAKLASVGEASTAGASPAPAADVPIDIPQFPELRDAPLPLSTFFSQNSPNALERLLEALQKPDAGLLATQMHQLLQLAWACSDRPPPIFFAMQARLNLILAGQPSELGPFQQRLLETGLLGNPDLLNRVLTATRGEKNLSINDLQVNRALERLKSLSKPRGLP